MIVPMKLLIHIRCPVPLWKSRRIWTRLNLGWLTLSIFLSSYKLYFVYLFISVSFGAIVLLLQTCFIRNYIKNPVPLLLSYLDHVSVKISFWGFFLASLLLLSVNGIRLFTEEVTSSNGDETEMESDLFMKFLVAPAYQNGPECPGLAKESLLCDPSIVHIAVTIDPEYLSGTMAAIHSVLKHGSCPENLFFHFVASDSSLVNANDLTWIVKSAFPFLSFKAFASRSCEFAALEWERKPWVRPDADRPCPVDFLWAPYNLYEYQGYPQHQQQQKQELPRFSSDSL